MVVTENAALRLRILAWAKLIKIWGALRFDDLQKIHPANLAMHGGRLTTTLRITKTSGPGKECKSCLYAYLNMLTFGMVHGRSRVLNFYEKLQILIETICCRDSMKNGRNFIGSVRPTVMSPRILAV